MKFCLAGCPLPARPAVRTSCPLGQLPQRSTFVLSAACSWPATIECCLGRRVWGCPRPDSSLKMRRPPAHEEKSYRGFRSGYSAFDCLASGELSESFGGKPPANLRKNVVACEVHVIATGARPSEKGGQRELFTEETTTALVFEWRS